jgi:tetratricopeptide (TPR) repeat protein
MAQEAARPGTLKLCLIYARADRRWYARLEKYLKILERHRPITFWHVQDIPAGSEREQFLIARLTAADLCVYLLSPDLLGSENYAEVEPQQIVERYRRGEVRIVPVILRPLPLDLLDPPFAELELLPDEKRPATAWRDRDAAMLNVMMGVRRVVEKMIGLVSTGFTRASHEASPEMEERLFGYLPYHRNKSFTGRDELLTTLHERLSSSRDGLPAIQALTGIGGIGKTQIALEYAYRYRREYQALLWARADTLENLAADGLLLAGSLNLPVRNSAESEFVLTALKNWLQHHAGWLLILDNVVDLKLVNGFLPAHYRGDVLLTTRLQDPDAAIPSLLTLPLEVEEGARLLLSRVRSLRPGAAEHGELSTQYQQAQEIVRLLDGLPLALDQAGAYIEEMGESLEQYLQRYQQERAELLGYRGPNATGHPASVSATFTLAFAEVKQLHQPAADLLRLCAFFHPAAIPEALLIAETPSGKQAGPLPSIFDRAELHVALNVLLFFSLVKRDPGSGSLSVHRLVQAVLKDSMEEQEQRLWAERALALVRRAWPERGMAGWPRCQDYLPHALLCADLIARLNLRSEDALGLLNEVGAYLSERALYQEAERLLLQALALSESVHGVDDPVTASVLQDLGWLEHRRYQHASAEEHYRRALAIRERALGPEDPRTARILYLLGLLYLNLSQQELAEPLLRRALSIQESQLGAEHPQVADTLNVLGMLARAQKEYEQAEILYRRALAIREKKLGSETPETATSVSNLAALAFNREDRADYAQAEALYRRVLEMRERLLGSEHPDTAAALSALALLCDRQKRYVEGEPLARRALTIQTEMLGREHRDTALTMMTLARLRYHQGDFLEAEPLAEEAVAILARVLHPHNPNFITSLNDLALIYRAQAKYEQARPLLQRALALSEAARRGENEDARTADIRANLATLPPQIEPSAQGDTSAD